MSAVKTVRKKRVTLCLGDQLYQHLKVLAGLENRHFQDQVVYLVEVMLAIAQWQPRFRLTPEPKETTSDHCVAVVMDFDGWLGKQISQFQESYGLSRQQVIRTLLWMGLNCREQVGQQDLVLRKEELVELALEHFQGPTHKQ